MSYDERKYKARQRVEAFLDVYAEMMQETNFKGYDRKLMQDIRLIDVDPAGGATWELDIDEHWGNMNGVMHGGAYGVIFDMCTAIAMNSLAARESNWHFLAGVTRSLNISYLKAVSIGSTVRVKATVIQHGKMMSLIRGIMESPDGKIVYATAEHHKVSVPMAPEHAKKMREAKERRGVPDGQSKL